MKIYSPTQLCGFKAEKIASNYLKTFGFKEVACNFRTLFGEIDLIMEDKKFLVFVEVRLRQSNAIVKSAESINLRKQKKIIRTATAYLQRYPTYKSCRFDVIAIQTTPLRNEINWIKDAFQVQ